MQDSYANSQSSSAQWPPLGHETLSWERGQEELVLIPKSRRRRILPTYEAAVPLELSTRDLALPAPLSRRLSEVLAEVTRFDAEQSQRGYELPAVLLRSESSASSQIEHLTSSVRNVALAELTSQAPHNAELIAGNVAAMRKALTLPSGLSIERILDVHQTLMSGSGVTFGGELRQEQVWIGGTAFSPHGALYVPPAWQRVRPCLEDLLAFARRTDVGPIEKAAIFHAQFETVHPFVDGNGRTGRALLHKILRDEGVLTQMALPVSAGLLHNVSEYLSSLTRFQEGDPTAVIEQLANALELAVGIGHLVASRMDAALAAWESVITERRGSSMRRLPDVLVSQPVVDSSYLSAQLGISRRAATDLIARACEYGILRPVGNRRRGEFYQADAIIDVLEEVSSLEGIRRLFR